MTDEQIEAIKFVWEGICKFVRTREANGSDKDMIHVWLAAALMDAATIVGHSRGMDEAAFCALAAEHFRLTEIQLAEWRAKVSN